MRSGCPGQRLAADDLEAAIKISLLDSYGDFDVFQDAIKGAYAQVVDERPRLHAEPVSTEGELRETTAAIDRYLRAFETGAMAETVCAPRLADLSARRNELIAHRDALACQLDGALPPLPDRETLDDLSETVRNAIENGSPDVVKQLFDELIDRIDITPDRQAQPWYWVPTPDSGKPGPPAAARASRTPVRMGSHQVGKPGRYYNTKALVGRLEALIAKLPDPAPYLLAEG